MSPEQWESSELTVKVDVYAFGVLLNELIVGVAPWKGLASPMAIGFRVCKGERPVTAQPSVEEGEGGSGGSGIREALVEAPPELCALVERCWAPDAPSRPTMLEARRAIEGWLATSPRRGPPAASTYQAEGKSP